MAETMKKRLGDLLIESGIISQEQLQQALAYQRGTKLKLGDVLLQYGFITEKQLIEVLEVQLGIPHLTLSTFSLDTTLTQVVTESMAKRYQVIPVRIRKDTRKLMIAMVDPLDYFAIEDLRMSTGYNIEPAIISKDEVQRAIARMYGLQDSMDLMLKDMGTQSEEIRESEITDGDSPVVRLVNQMIEQAVSLRASDIHVDPSDTGLLIRYRIDGFLRNEKMIPRSMQGVITARLKIMANLNIAERRLPQDGRMKMTFDMRTVDLRVSTLPTINGEKIVLRILDLSIGVKELHSLDMNEANLDHFYKMIARPYGIVLITGPTGSGKTTTLYSALSHLNKENVNLVTIEDPVEYQLQGINQVQVSPVTGLTFAKGLRSILRQDPNVIMVGEIRDVETAEISIRASLTGHLVFSTLHTNDSISTIIRLRDMGIEPYLIASSLVGVVSQRLVRRICPDCRVAYEPSEQERIYLRRKGSEISRLYKGQGCGICNQTGYRGRLAIHETLWVDDDLRQLIVNEQSIGDIKAYASRAGHRALFHDGLDKAAQGLTTLQEIIREADEEL